MQQNQVPIIYLVLWPIFLILRYLIYSLSAGKKGKLAAGGKKKEFPVETDPHKLVNYCCGSNIYKEGEDVKLKPESEYPEWLWSIRTGTFVINFKLDQYCIIYDNEIKFV